MVQYLTETIEIRALFRIYKRSRFERNFLKFYIYE